MKYFVIGMLCVIMVAAVGFPIAFAAPSASPSPVSSVTPSPAPSSTPSPSPDASLAPSPAASDGAAATDPLSALIGYNSKGYLVLHVQARLLDLGFYTYKITGKYGPLTRNAIIAFQIANKLPADGAIGPKSAQTLYSNTAVRRTPDGSTKIIKGPDIKRTPTQFGEKGDWSTQINALIPVNTTLTIVDFNTLAEFKMVRTGGKNHADVESATTTDNAAYVKAFGGGASWEKRAVFVRINGKLYAASLFGWPHGSDSVADNAMQGHTDLYFPGSLSEVAGLPDAEHELRIARAAGEQ